jgi:hypothetical protein
MSDSAPPPGLQPVSTSRGRAFARYALPVVGTLVLLPGAIVACFAALAVLPVFRDPAAPRALVVAAYGVVSLPTLCLAAIPTSWFCAIRAVPRGGLPYRHARAWMLACAACLAVPVVDAVIAAVMFSRW